MEFSQNTEENPDQSTNPGAYLSKRKCFVYATLCNPVVPVGGLLNALQNYSAVNHFKNSFTKLILCLKA